jgi:hypothetical protein
MTNWEIIEGSTLGLFLRYYCSMLQRGRKTAINYEIANIFIKHLTKSIFK